MQVSQLDIGTAHTYDFVVAGTGTYPPCAVKVDDTYIGNIYGRGIDGTGPLSFFAYADGRYNASCRIYSAYVSNGTNVADFIPVRVGSVGYMYDRVSGKLFGNAGTGDFVLGPDVVPVEYIESTGTQWIDTGILPSIPCRIKSRVSFAKTDVYQGGVACGWGDDNTCFATPMMFSSGKPTMATPGIGYKFFDIGYIAGELLDSEMELDNEGSGYFKINGTPMSVSRWSVTKPITENILLGGMGHFNTSFDKYPFLMGAGGRIYFANIKCGSNKGIFIPVRVGTGSTWEGAMMDVLTRRIYRNAGTGAFTYGNDLKYPIPAS